MRKFLLHLALSERLALVQKLTFFDNSKKMDPLVFGSLNICVHNMITIFLFHVVRVELYWFQRLCYLSGVQ
jgi:hypothetical protein